MIYPSGGGAKCHTQKEGVIYLWEGVIYPLGGDDLPHQNTSPRAPVGAKKLPLPFSEHGANLMFLLTAGQAYSTRAGQ